MKVAGFVLLWSWAVAGVAQTIYKCIDAQRRVAYSNITCDKQGLQDGGPVADRTTSMPFVEPPKATPSKPAVTPPLPAEPAKGPSEKLTK